jgi:hypothetical protein
MPLLSKLTTIIFQLLASTVSCCCMIKLFAYIIESFENTEPLMESIDIFFIEVTS